MTISPRARTAARYGLAVLLAPILLPAQSRAASFDCLINPSLLLKIGSPVSTTIESVAVDRGSIVHKGDELARLHSSVQSAYVALRKARAASTAELLSRQAKLEAAQTEVSRASRQIEGLSVTGQKLAELRTLQRVAEQDLALAALEQQMAQLDVARAEAEVEERVIRTPIDGIVTERKLGPGEYVHQDANVVVVAALDPLFVEVFLPVRYSGQVHVGETDRIVADDPKGGSHLGKVIVVDRMFDAGSGTFGVRLELPNPQLDIPAGTRCRVSFDLDEHVTQTGR